MNHLGKHQKEMLAFVNRLKPSEISGIARDQTTQRAAISLAKRGLIEIERYDGQATGPYRFIKRLPVKSCGKRIFVHGFNNLATATCGLLRYELSGEITVMTCKECGGDYYVTCTW